MSESDAQRIRDDAAAWIVKLHEASGSEHAALAAECDAWLQCDPRHRKTFEQMRDMWSAIDGPRVKRRRRAIGAVGVLFVLAALLAWQLPWALWQADYRTAPGEIRRVRLADDSVLTLNTDTAVDVELDAGRRTIRLLRGELWADVHHDARGRPFVVTTPYGSATAMGTHYSVRLASGYTRVAVQRSAVRVTPRHAVAAARVLQAGQTARLWPDRVDGPQTAPVDAPSWTHGQLVFRDVPLARVAARLSRYRRGSIHLTGAAERRRLTFTGVLPAADNDAAVAALAASLGLRVRYITPYWVWLGVAD